MENNNVFVSIVIPTYNRAELLKKTLHSFLAQTFTEFEIIVVDDGGKDNTKEVVDSFNDKRFSYHWKENAERGAARNYGARLAKGKWINYFDSDDIAYPSHTETAFRYVTANPEINVFHTSYDWVDIETSQVFKKSVLTGELNKRILQANCLSCNNVFIKKELCTDFSFSEKRELSGSEDWVLWLRLSASYPIMGLPDITSSIVQHSARSMITASGKSCYERAVSLHSILNEDKVFMQQFSKKQANKVFAEPIHLASLHYALEKKKTKAVKCLFEAASLSFTKIFSRRTLAITKYLLLRW